MLINIVSFVTNDLILETFAFDGRLLTKTKIKFFPKEMTFDRRNRTIHHTQKTYSLERFTKTFLIQYIKNCTTGSILKRFFCYKGKNYTKTQKIQKKGQ